MNRSRLHIGDSSIEVHHQGAHLSSWVCQGKEQLFLSQKALVETGKAIRGGVPVCFPQFAAFGPGQKHGFARNVLWHERTATQSNHLCFELGHDADSFTRWPHEFNVELDIELESNALSIRLGVENLSNQVMEFTAALHSYFCVDSILNARVGGLQSCEFWDNGNVFEQREHQEQAELRIDNIIDRVYFNTLNRLSLTDGHSTRLIESQGFSDTVIWNPWEEGARALVDMADDEYKKMLCIESANVQTPRRLAPSDSWQGLQKITVVTT